MRNCTWIVDEVAFERKRHKSNLKLIINFDHFLNFVVCILLFFSMYYLLVHSILDTYLDIFMNFIELRAQRHCLILKFICVLFIHSSKRAHTVVDLHAHVVRVHLILLIIHKMYTGTYIQSCRYYCRFSIFGPSFNLCECGIFYMNNDKQRTN